MAAEMQEVTCGNCEKTESKLEHLLEDVHEILQIVHKFATPEVQAALDSYLPVLRWKARRNGRASVQ